MEENKKLNEDLEIIREFLDKHDQRFMIVGSSALMLCGIPFSRDHDDIDLEVIETEEGKKLFELLEDASMDVPKDYPSDGVIFPYVFTYKGVKVNIWTVKEFNHSCVHWDGMKVATVYSNLKKKMELKRDKDYQDLQYIIKKFTEL